MKTLNRILAGAALGAGMAIALAPIASATDPAFPNDPYGFHDYRDRTDTMIPIQNIGQVVASGSSYADRTKDIIVSPYGVTHKIECRGDGHYVGISDCRQFDDNNQPHNLNPIGVFGRRVWLY